MSHLFASGWSAWADMSPQSHKRWWKVNYLHPVCVHLQIFPLKTPLAEIKL